MNGEGWAVRARSESCGRARLDVGAEQGSFAQSHGQLNYGALCHVPAMHTGSEVSYTKAGKKNQLLRY